MPKGLDPRWGAGKTARVRGQGKGGALKPGQALVFLPVKDGETESSPVAYLAPLRRTLIDDNRRHVNVVVCGEDCCAEAWYREFAATTAVTPRLSWMARYFVAPCGSFVWMSPSLAIRALFLRGSP